MTLEHDAMSTEAISGSPAVASQAPAGARRSAAPEGRLLRSTRLQLTLWSAASTLLVLVALGAVLYLVIAQQLRTDSEAQLQRRAQIMASFPRGLDRLAQRQQAPLVPPMFVGRGTVIGPISGVPLSGTSPGTQVSGPLAISVAPDAGQPGFVFGGSTSGTIALVAGVDGLINGQPVPDQVGLGVARAGTPTFSELSVSGTPVRAYSQAVQLDGQTLVLQVVADRSTELQTLQTTLLVLLLGGLVVVAAAAGLGWVYAGRALVPIRESLRRQRDFAADASHELRTPLTVIRGNVQVLERDGGIPATSREALADIDAEVTRMTSLVEQLLLLARTDSDAAELELSPCDLADEAADAISGFAPLAQERNVRLALDVSPAPLRGDALRLRQLCAILVDNAVRHAPADGTVTVTVGSTAGRATMTVDDDGPGIRPEDMPRVFDRFWRASDAPAGGTGLGLAIAAWIVDRHGGRIRALDRPGGGARFSVELPAL